MKKDIDPRTAAVAATATPVLAEQRRARRLVEACYLTYSGISGGSVIVGEGTSLDFSAEGFGIEGSRGVTPGSLLTLCFCLPDGKEPLIVEEVRVAWVRGKRFGVQSLAIGHGERKRLTQYVGRHHGRSKKKTIGVLDFTLPLHPVAI